MIQFDLHFILPEIILAVTALIVLMAGAFKSDKQCAGSLALGAVIVSAIFLAGNSAPAGNYFSGMLIHDGFSFVFRQILLLVTGMVILLSMGYKDLLKEDNAEYYFFLLVVTVALMLAASANNLMMIYIALETISIVSYIMAGFLKRDEFSSEAGVKYFLFGSLSTGITLYGISLVYGLFGTLDLNSIATAVATGSVNTSVLPIVLVLVLVGFAFKCSLVPFHMWTPDVYEGAPTPVSAFFSVAPKAVGFAFFLRIFIENFQPVFVYWTPLAGFMAILTMTIGNITALRQGNIKRLLAYSTIAQAGYIMVGLAVATSAGIQASIFYIFIYAFMNLGAFGAAIAIAHSLNSEKIEDYAGLYQRDPHSAIIMTASLLSLAGIPPLAGFLAKFLILACAVSAGYTFLAVIVVLNSVIALYYYARIVKIMFLAQPGPMTIVPQSPALKLLLMVTLIANLTFGLWPQPLINWLTHLLPLV